MEPHFVGVPVGPKDGGLSGHEDIPIAPETCERDTEWLGTGRELFLFLGSIHEDLTFICACRLRWEQKVPYRCRFLVGCFSGED